MGECLTVPMPAEVQAAIAAYLAARVDDVTWDAYVDSLGPGVALDVATTLCQWTEADARASDWIQSTDYEFDPTGHDGPVEPYGVRPVSTSLTEFIDGDAGLVPPRITLECERGTDDGFIAAWIVTLEGDDWESTGRVTKAEYRAWWPIRTDTDRVDPWAVAACRAACHAWAPSWVREQESK